MLKKTLSVFTFFLYITMYASEVIQGPSEAPPAPSAAGGPWTPGSQDKTPIDEYTIYLIGLAILIGAIYFTAKKYKKSLI